MNYKMKLQFEGTRYLGWQKQKTNSNTVQGKLESVLEKLFEEKIQVIGGSRTDSGVHALEYIANFNAKQNLEPKKVQEYLAMYLPDDIRIIEISFTNDRFHARYNSKSKTYLYKIDNSAYGSVFEKRFAWHIDKELDIEKMQEAALLIIGKHDFKGFTNKSKNKNTVRNVQDIKIQKNGEIVEIFVKGESFLLNMVRIIVGTLKEVGLSERSIESINEIFETKDREIAGERAVAKGLFLVKSEY